jgi:hypothetical protein
MKWLQVLCPAEMQHIDQRVVYPGHADKYLGPLANRLRVAYQPVSRTPNRFFNPSSTPFGRHLSTPGPSITSTTGAMFETICTWGHGVTP